MVILTQLLIVVILVAIVIFLIRIFEPKLITETTPFYPNEGVETKSFSWSVHSISKTHDLICKIDIRMKEYSSARLKLLNGNPSKTYMRSISDNFFIASNEITDVEYGINSTEVKQIKDYLDTYSSLESLSLYELSNIILSFVHEQCIIYNYDIDSTGYSEYFRFPIETIYDQTGDCDCKSILASALFKAFNFKVAFAVLPGHAAIAININGDLPFVNYVDNKGNRWFYCESTGDYWQPGQIPDGIDLNLLNLYELA